MASPDQKPSTKARSRPSALWCLWQALRGTYTGRASIPDADFRGKWVVITGGNNGIGKESALQFASWGASIVLACRNPPPHETPLDEAVAQCKAAGEAAGHLNQIIEWWPCDLGSLATVEAFSARWLATSRPLDVLVNNAGIAAKNGSVIKTVDGFEIVHQVNFLAHVLLTMTLLPALSQAVAPRVIYTTSCLQFLGSFDLASVDRGQSAAYPNNKLYLQVWLTELQHWLIQHERYRHVTVQGVHPGFVRTSIWTSESEAVDPNKTSKMSWMEKLIWKQALIDIQQGSLAITHAASAVMCGPNLSLQGVGSDESKGGGRYFNRIWEDVPMPQTNDMEYRQEIWQYVDKKLELQTRAILV